MEKEELQEVVKKSEEKVIPAKTRLPAWAKWIIIGVCLALVVAAVVYFVIPSPLKYKPYWLGYYTLGATYSVIPGEYDPGRIGDWQDPDAKQTATITIDGKKIQGTYKKTSKDYDYYQAEEAHYYECEGKAEEFSIDSKGNLVSYSAPMKVYTPANSTSSNSTDKPTILVDTEPLFTDDEILTEAECLEIAKNFIYKNVNASIDFDNYELISDSTRDTYHFRFTGHVRGYATTERINISIYKNGDFARFSSRNLGAFASAPRINEANATAAATRKLDSFYKGKHATYKDFLFEYTILEDGSFALICTPSVKIDGRIEQPQILIK